MKKTRLLALLAALTLALSACSPIADNDGNIPTVPSSTGPTLSSGATTAPTTTEPPTTEPPQPRTIRLTAIGDMLLHNTVSNACKTGDSFDFNPIFKHVKGIVSDSDIAFVNQEIMLTGEVKAYPRMAAPFEVAAALKETGFNVVNLATNHSMDQGKDGLLKSIAAIKEQNFDIVLGAFETEKESNVPALLEVDGITFGFLSFTYGLNGFSLPKDMPWLCKTLPEGNESAAAAVIKTAVDEIRPLCDYLIVSMHWGVEYTHKPTDYQRRQAQLLCDGGADLIIGHHPHVIQPLEWIESDSGHQTLCAFSLGNFVSNQHKYSTMLGGLLDVTLTFDPTENKLTSTDAGIIPLMTHYEKGLYETYLLEDYTEELIKAHTMPREGGSFSLDYFVNLAKDVLGQSIIWGKD